MLGKWSTLLCLSGDGGDRFVVRYVVRAPPPQWVPGPWWLLKNVLGLPFVRAFYELCSFFSHMYALFLFFPLSYSASGQALHFQVLYHKAPCGWILFNPWRASAPSVQSVALFLVLCQRNSSVSKHRQIIFCRRAPCPPCIGNMAIWCWVRCLLCGLAKEIPAAL